MRRYWIERDDAVSPHMADIRGVPSVRVFGDRPPFALGEVVAFFVGPDAEAHAERFVADPASFTEAQTKIEHQRDRLRVVEASHKDLKRENERLRHDAARLRSIHENGLSADWLRECGEVPNQVTWERFCELVDEQVAMDRREGEAGFQAEMVAAVEATDKARRMDNGTWV